MKTYCPTRPAKASIATSTCSGRKAMKSTTASKRAASASRAGGAVVAIAGDHAHGPRTREALRPRFSTVTSCPCSTARSTQAVLMFPVPPRKRMFRR